jgi:hypothetical protein
MDLIDCLRGQIAVYPPEVLFRLYYIKHPTTEFCYTEFKKRLQNQEMVLKIYCFKHRLIVKLIFSFLYHLLVSVFLFCLAGLPPDPWGYVTYQLSNTYHFCDNKMLLETVIKKEKMGPS